MKFESFNQPKNVAPAESVEGDNISVEKEPEQSIEERSNKLAQFALAALTFYGVADVAEMLVLRDGGASAYAAESQTLSESVSTGRVRLSSGEEIVIPKPGSTFDRVKVYMPEGKAPDRLILLFSQTHRVSKQQLEGYSPQVMMEFLEQANDSQHRIYEGLKQLVDQGSLYSVCSEGVTNWGITNSDLKDYSTQSTSSIARILVNYFPGSEFERAVEESKQVWQQQYDATGDGSNFEAITKSYPEITNYVDKYKYTVGATELLAATGKLIPCPGESEEASAASEQYGYLFKKPRNEWTQEEAHAFSKFIFEDRENAAIKTIMTNMPDPVVGLSFGAAHDFTNNIDEWNARNPDQQIGLVDMRAPYHP